MAIEKPFSQACENNKQPILQILQRVFVSKVTLWEIGSGTGQHACYFSEQLPHIVWQPTDRAENLPGIKLWVKDAALQNINTPLKLDVTDYPWRCTEIDALFTSNTLHIMNWAEVQVLFSKLGQYLKTGAMLCIYGPFNYQGAYTSASNAQFDQWLKTKDPLSGIRDFEAIQCLAEAANIELKEDFAMPANNRLLIWQKS